MEKHSYVYIMTNPNRSVLCTGVTSDLLKRVHQHKNKLMGGFSARYNTCLPVYYERHDSILAAIAREKQIKGGSRAKKEALIVRINPAWADLSEAFLPDEEGNETEE